jgi:hypothetical protein
LAPVAKVLLLLHWSFRAKNLFPFKQFLRGRGEGRCIGIGVKFKYTFVVKKPLEIENGFLFFLFFGQASFPGMVRPGNTN